MGGWATCVLGGGRGDRVRTSSTPANNPAGIYFQDPEITPAGQGIFRTNKSSTKVEQFPPEVEVRAIVESQIMAKFVHARSLGYQITASSRVLATGGASQNPRILQVGNRLRGRYFTVQPGHSRQEQQ